MKTVYDDFSKLPISKMAQQISNMTYNFKKTNVPPIHYKKMLSTNIEEVVEENIAINLINIYYNTLKTLLDENPKWFMQALLCLDEKVKPNTIKANEFHALEKTYQKFFEDKSTFLKSKYSDMFRTIKVSGEKK
ncbi:hypothetical protein [Liquorilactobacillus hordei]|uniref:hypothetical protein n=1 Tax=Liquorilactobacillus hordei TaxID=468911 RepID=UPI001CC06CDF|nr:hypothetical protein [Liquorilactobacillus hordei]MBZ2406678.1 hypothetical protein [Liquorilactobacillus hordei]